jgi:histidinol-phosphate aminotransferase
MSWRDLLRPALSGLHAYTVPPATGLVRMDANESPWPPDEALRARVAEIAAATELNRYPDPTARPLREALAARHRGVSPEQIVVGNGSDEVIAMLMAALARPRPGRQAPAIAYPVPTFSMYGIHARGHGVDTVEIPTRADFSLDPDETVAALNASRPNLFFLSRPNNPTGTQWPRAVAEAAAGIEDLVTVVDEAYGPFADETCVDLLEKHPNVVLLQSLSKVGFAALRVGYGIAHPELAQELDKVRMPYNVSALSQALATEAVRAWDRFAGPAVAKVIAERERLTADLAGLPGLETFPTKANFVLCRTADPVRVFDALRERGILIRCLHREGSPLEGCLRITVGRPEENARLLEALREILE